MTEKSEKKRFEDTLNFLRTSVPKGTRIIDIGSPNKLGRFLTQRGYVIENVYGHDLDMEPELVAKDGFEVATAFEILEHLVNPMGVLTELRTPKLIATVPLRLWFRRAFYNPKDAWDRHYHEFEDWQFDWLLDKSGWKIIRREKWKSPTGKIGWRPILRKITNCYYAVEAVKK